MSRRAALVCLASVTVLSCVGSFAPAAEADGRPMNVLFFLSDDHRNDLLGCAGHPVLKTPTLDRLAADGVRFENMFVTTPICAASRATLLTGVAERTHKFTFGTPPVAADLLATSYPAALRGRGYRTGYVGKFGVGASAEARKAMFDVYRPLNRTPYFKPQPDGSTRYVEEIAGDVAVEFLRSQPEGRPFCLTVGFNAPHAEDNDKANLYPAPAPFDALYESTPIPPPPYSGDEHFAALPPFLREAMGRDRWHWQFDTPEKYARNVRDYYAMISAIDAVTGRVLDELDRLGLAENTVVVFTGDNGYFLGERGISGKWVHFDKSLRVPLIVRDPRLSPEERGRVVDEMVLNADLPATFLDYAGAEVPQAYQGRSLKPLVEGRTAGERRTDFFCEHLMENPDLPKWEGVRGERFVYARYFEQDPPYEFLHDLEADPGQLRNLAGDPTSADVLATLRRRCDELRDAVGGAYSKERFPLAGRKVPLD